MLIVNQVEASMLTGGGTRREMAARLKALGPEIVIVTLGSDGLVCDGPDGLIQRPAEEVEVRSTHGAGDVFCGAFAAMLESGADLTEALYHGQKAAALKVAGDRQPV